MHVLLELWSVKLWTYLPKSWELQWQEVGNHIVEWDWKKHGGTKREDKKGKEKEKEKEKSLGGIGSFDPIPFYS